MSNLFDEAKEILADKALRELGEDGRTIQLRRLLGPLTDTEVLTHREASILFCQGARGASQGQLAKDFGVSSARIGQIAEGAQKKIKATQLKIQRGTAIWQWCPFKEPKRCWITNFESCSEAKACLRDNCRYKRQE